MHKLSLHEFSDLVSQVYQNGSEGDFNHRCLPTLAAVFSSDVVALVRISDAAERDRIFASIGIDDFILRAMMVNIRSYSCAMFSKDQFISDRVIVSPKMKAREKPRDNPENKHWLMGVVAKTPTHLSLIWLSRDINLGEYTSAEIELIDLLLPHLRNATELSDDVTDLNMKIETAEQILNRTPFGMFFMDINGTLLYKNEPAARLLTAKDTFSIRGNRLYLLKDEQREKLDEFFAEFSDCSDPHSMGRRNLYVQNKTGNKGYNLIFIPMLTKRSSGIRHNGKIVLLQVHNPEPSTAGQLVGLETFYKLTATETKVCQRLYLSRNLSEVAEFMGLSINTVKTHLIRSFRKIGVSTQAELLQKLALHPKTDW